MKNISCKLQIIIILAILPIHSFAQSSIDILKYNCFSAPVKYFEEGILTEGLLVFMNYSDKEMPGLHYSNVYLLNKKGQNYQLVGDTSAFISVNEIKVSRDSKYLALMLVGEGHPWIEIYDLQKLISESKQELIAEINPYPGNVYMIGWQGNKLIVESDINLKLKNEGKDLSDLDMYEKFRKFLFDMDTKKYVEFK